MCRDDTRNAGGCIWEALMVGYARLIGDLSKAWGGWQPSEIDIGGGMASPRDLHNKEFPVKGNLPHSQPMVAVVSKQL